MASPKRYRLDADSDSVRPIRLWLPKTEEVIRYYYYSDPHSAQDRALLLVAWQKVNEPIEVYNAATGRLLGVYKQTVDGRIEYERF